MDEQSAGSNEVGRTIGNDGDSKEDLKHASDSFEKCVSYAERVIVAGLLTVR
jgi:hypothetical protein